MQSVQGVHSNAWLQTEDELLAAGIRRYGVERGVEVTPLTCLQTDKPAKCSACSLQFCHDVAVACKWQSCAERSSVSACKTVLMFAEWSRQRSQLPDAWKDVRRAAGALL